MRLLRAFSKALFLVAAGVNRLKSPWQILKSEPTHVGCYNGFIFLSVVLAVVTLFCGCRTPSSLFTASSIGWHIRQGQALWRPERGLPEFGGDLVMATDIKGRALVEFDKTPLSVVFAQVTPDRWLIRFPQKKMSFSGYEFKPTRFAWLYLPAAVGGKPLPKPFVFETKSDGTWRLENRRTGELLEGYLSP